MRMEGEQILPGDALAPVGQAQALLPISMNVAPEHENEFNEWYNIEHLPALGAVPGVLAAQRYRGRAHAALRRDLPFREPGRAQFGLLEDRREHTLDRAHAAAISGLHQARLPAAPAKVSSAPKGGLSGNSADAAAR